MEMLTCINCGHSCHCKGVGPYYNTNQCLTVPDCGCLNCVHEIIKEKNMKIIEKIKKIIVWPFKKLKQWWHTWG